MNYSNSREKNNNIATTSITLRSARNRKNFSNTCLSQITIWSRVLAKKGFGGVDNKEPASDWEAPKGVLALQEALLNFGDVYNKLWPLDNTPRRLERVLVHYRYGEKLGGTERERCKIMEDFCDKILRENSCRAVREKAPLTVRQAKERW